MHSCAPVPHLLHPMPGSRLGIVHTARDHEFLRAFARLAVYGIGFDDQALVCIADPELGARPDVNAWCLLHSPQTDVELRWRPLPRPATDGPLHVIARTAPGDAVDPALRGPDLRVYPMADAAALDALADALAARTGLARRDPEAWCCQRAIFQDTLGELEWGRATSPGDPLSTA